MRHSDTRKLLWTLVEITVISEDPKTPERIESVFDYFRSIEEEFSRFRPDSALSILNRDKIRKVSSRFIALMRLSRQKYEETDGLFNPLVQVSSLGYSRSFEEGHFERTGSLVDTDFSRVLIGTDAVSLGENQMLDFGGIAKGYAVDMASAILLAFGYDDFFVNAGGDIYAHGLNAEGLPWTIGIENPFSLAVEASIELRNCAVATSGRYKRKWDMEGEEYHHIMDPLSGENKNTIMSVTLVGKKCVDCDSFTKSVFNLSPEAGLEKLRDQKLEGLLYTGDGRIVYTKGLEERYGLIFAASDS